MEFTKAAFVPDDDGLRNTDVYPATPASEDEAREQIQGLLDQLKDAVNKLIGEMENAETGTSGAERIGSAAISNLDDAGVFPTTVHEQIALLGAKFQSAIAGEISISEAIGPGEVTGSMIADGAVDSRHYAEGSIDSEHLSAGCVTGTKIGNAQVDSNHYVAGSIDPGHLADGAVTELKIGSGAVTATKIGMGAVIAEKIADLNVTTSKLANNGVTTDKLNAGAVTEAKLSALAGLTMISGAHIKFGSIDDYVYYDSDLKKLMLKLNGCTAVQLAPVIVSAQTAPADGTYPAGTLYVQVEE